MDFEDTPEEARFRAEVRNWLDANAPKTVSRRWRRTGRTQRQDLPRRLPGLAGQEGRCRLCPHHLAEGSWRLWRHADPAGHLQSGRRQDPSTEGLYGPFAIGLGMCIPTLMTYGAKDAIAPLCEAGAAWRGDLVPALLRTGRRLRCCRSSHPRREGRRRLGHQRPEDLDHRRADFRLRHSAHPHRSRTCPSTRA